MKQDTWREDAKLLHATIDRVIDRRKVANNQNKAFLALYYQSPGGYISNGRTAENIREMGWYQTFRDLGFNLTQEVVDAAHAMICAPVQAKVTPVGADSEIHLKAEQLGMVLDGINEACNADAEFAQTFRDLELCDVGAIESYYHKDTSEIRKRRLNPLQLGWDEDGRGGYHTVYAWDEAPKLQVIAEYGLDDDHDLPSWQADSILGVDDFTRRPLDETCRINRAYALKLGDRKGKWAITCGETVLDQGEWDADVLPIVIESWKRNHKGVAGVPLARCIAPYHIWCDELVQIYYEGLDGQVPSVFAPDDMKFQGMSNTSWRHIGYDRALGKPEVIVPKTVGDQVIDAIDKLRERAFAQGGVNVNAASGEKPVGLDSAPAQQQWIELVNVRLSQQQHVWERLHKASARVDAQLLKSSYKSKKAIARAPQSDWLEELDVNNLNFNEDKFKIGFSLVSGLGRTYSMRVQQFHNLQELGVADAGDVAQGLQVPDIEAKARRLNAERNLIDKMISDALNHGKVVSALPFQNLQEVVRICGLAYQDALVRRKYSAPKLMALYKVIKSAKNLMASSAAAAPPDALAAATPAAPEAAMPLAGAEPVVPGTMPSTAPAPAT